MNHSSEQQANLNHVKLSLAKNEKAYSNMGFKSIIYIKQNMLFINSEQQRPDMLTNELITPI